jgi:hypothetical protein
MGRSKSVLKWLMQEFSPDAVPYQVQDAIKDRDGDAACGVDWPNIRLMLNNLDELYFSDLSLSDLYCQIAHMSDRFDSLPDTVEQHREDFTEHARLIESPTDEGIASTRTR